MAPTYSSSGKARALPVKTQLMILVVAIAAVFAAAIFAYWVSGRGTREDVVAAAPPGTFRPTKAQWDALAIAPVKDESFQNAVTTDGEIAFDDAATTPVFSPYSGPVVKLIAKPGDTVARGSPLMIVDAAEFAQAQSDLAVASAQEKLATANEKRQHDLFLAKAGAQKDWLQSQSDLAAAQAALAAVRNRLRILGKSDAEIDALQRNPATLRSSADAIVRAPIAGTVVQRQVALGQNIQSGAGNPVFTIGNLHEVWALANVRAVDAGHVHVGDAMQIRIAALPQRVFTAKVDWVSTQIDPATHRLPVRATFANADGALKPGMFAQATILDGKPRSAPAVAPEAIVYEGDTARVYVANSDGTLALREIKTGEQANDNVEVKDGLKAGECIVTRGAVFIDRAATGN